MRLRAFLSCWVACLLALGAVASSQPGPDVSDRGWFGMRVRVLGERADETIDRLAVCSVAADGPAERAGVRPGDTILELDGQPMSFSSVDEMLAWFYSHEPGDVAAFLLERENGQRRVVEVEARAKPQHAQQGTE